MLCHRCGSHVPDSTDTCPTCGLRYDAAARQAAGAARRRGPEGAPYKPGDVVGGRYAIQEVVGSGPMGFVFRAQDQEIDVEVALKLVHPRLVQQPEERTQFSLSMRVGKKLNHPNLLRVYEEGVDADRPFFTMQLLEGMTLRRMLEQRVSRGQLFSLKDVDPLLSQMSAALDAAHRFGPHSDLKPENIIVLPDLLKVTDYGLGLAVPHLPFVQAQKGHRADVYIAPEYVNGGELDTRIDVYALGVILGEMLTGLTPVDGIPPELCVHHPDLPPALDSLYRRALNPNPLARPKSAGELYAEFATILSRVPPNVATHARSVLTPASAAATANARAATRPPPPVPTDMLPIPTGLTTVPASKPPEPKAAEARPPEPKPVEAKPAEARPPEPKAPEPKPAAPKPVEARPAPKPAEPNHEEEPPPPDATQPLDAETLAAIMGGPLPSRLLTEQALPYILAPASAKAPAPEQPTTPRAQAAPRPAAPAPRPSGPVQSLQPRASSPRHEARTQEPSAAVGRHEAKTIEPAPAVSRHEAKTLDPSPALSRSMEAPAVSGARSGLRTLEASPAVSGARAGARPPDSPTMSGARSGARTMDSPTMSGARTGARRVDNPMMSGARSGMRTGALPTLPVTKAAKGKSRSMLWMVLLSVAGLVVGAGGGFLVVRHIRQSQVAPVGPGSPVGNPMAAPGADCPAGMRLVAGGPFQLGSAASDPQRSLDDRDLAEVQVASYCVDEYEYPNQSGATPKTGVSWSEARGLCESAGKRLCTEEEWEKACKGPGNRRFPYGNTEAPDACNTETASGEDRALARSGQFQDCRSGPGLMDMAGNVAEWTATSGGSADYIQKGGAFDRPPSASRCSARTGVVPGDRLPSVGFRCCASAAR